MGWEVTGEVFRKRHCMWWKRAGQRLLGAVLEDLGWVVATWTLEVARKERHGVFSGSGPCLMDRPKGGGGARGGGALGAQATNFLKIAKGGESSQTGLCF